MNTLRPKIVFVIIPRNSLRAMTRLCDAVNIHVNINIVYDKFSRKISQIFVQAIPCKDVLPSRKLMEVLHSDRLLCIKCDRVSEIPSATVLPIATGRWGTELVAGLENNFII